jgi:hypothetical protein
MGTPKYANISFKADEANSRTHCQFLGTFLQTGSEVATGIAGSRHYGSMSLNPESQGAPVLVQSSQKPSPGPPAPLGRPQGGSYTHHSAGEPRRSHHFLCSSPFLYIHLLNLLFHSPSPVSDLPLA